MAGDADALSEALAETLVWLDTEAETADKADIAAKQRALEKKVSPAMGRLYGRASK